MERDILPSSAGKVHVIADFRQVHNLPGTLLGSGTRMLSKAHPNTGTIIFITESTFVTRMAQIFRRLVPRHQFSVVQTLEAAMEIIERNLADHSPIS